MKKLHFVGIGGIGMSGIASLLCDMGYSISGSDLKLNNLTAMLEAKGCRIFKGHQAAHIPADTQAIVYSSSIREDNPEMIEARVRGIPVSQRAEALGLIVNSKSGIAVCGTHGKTTTTSLISVMLERVGVDPTVVIGGEVELFNSNAKYGRGPYVVAEADESDASFLHLTPLYSVITNIEMEHMDHYRSMDQIREAFATFVTNTKPNGAVFYCHEDKDACRAAESFGGTKSSFGFAKEASIRADNISMEAFTTEYDCVYENSNIGRVRLQIPGRHNVLNSLACVLVGLKIGLPFEKIALAIKDFRGTKRRFHLRADVGGVILIDDYAHHPTEIRAVLSAAGSWRDRRVIVVFQPHRYTRTLHLAEEFGKCFTGANKLILTDIYPASERPIDGISVNMIYDKVKADGFADVTIMEKTAIADYVMQIKKPGDMVLVLGAGDIEEVATDLADKLKKENLDG